MAQRLYRVLVQLKDIGADEQQLAQVRHYTDPFARPPGSFKSGQSGISLNSIASEAKKTTFLPPNKIVDEIFVHSASTVRLSVKGNSQGDQPKRTMTFDVVGNEFDHRIRNELEFIAADLLVNENNCVLLQIEPLRNKCPLREIVQLLVTNPSQQVQSIQGDVKDITLEYHDLRKYEIVNMLSIRATPNSPKWNRRLVQFPNMLSLLEWLQTEYPRLWQAGQGHDYIEVQYTVVNRMRVMKKLKFAIFHFHLCKMDIETRTELRKFLQNLRVEKRQVKQTMIADCLREYFNGPAPWQTWFHFKVPITHHRSSTVTYDMLQMASLAYKNSHQLRENASIKYNDQANESMNTLPVDSTDSLADSKPLLDTVKTSSTTISSYGQLLDEQGGIKKMLLDDSSGKYPIGLSQHDLDRLSYWYNQLDDKLSHVLEVMEAYYKCKFEESMRKISQEVKNISSTVFQNDESDTSSSNESPENVGTKIFYRRDKDKLHFARVKYLKSLSFFRELKQRFQSSDVLKVYYNTKCYELCQRERRFIKDHLEKCQTTVADCLKKQLNELDIPDTIEGETVL